MRSVQNIAVIDFVYNKCCTPDKNTLLVNTFPTTFLLTGTVVDFKLAISGKCWKIRKLRPIIALEWLCSSNSARCNFVVALWLSKTHFKKNSEPWTVVILINGPYRSAKTLPLLPAVHFSVPTRCMDLLWSLKCWTPGRRLKEMYWHLIYEKFSLFYVDQ